MHKYCIAFHFPTLSEPEDTFHDSSSTTLSTISCYIAIGHVDSKTADAKWVMAMLTAVNRFSSRNRLWFTNRARCLAEENIIVSFLESAGFLSLLHRVEF